MEEKKKAKRAKFSGSIGYVLATAGSAVGLGNIWRFPYLAAKYGGGIFLLVYVLLAVTFGYTMIVSETVLGRLTRKSPVGAFAAEGGGKKGLTAAGGWLNAVIPMLIVPYYCVIGGWVLKYLADYIVGAAYSEDTFNTFIASPVPVEAWFLIFSGLTVLVILLGVNSGVERLSRVMMPALVVLAVLVAIYSCTRPGAAAGVKYFLVPKMSDFSVKTIIAALGQMFYSLSIAMGILYTYGSYMKRDVDVEKSTFQVELFDTGVAVLAGLMIIPAVFAFSGGSKEALNAGPSLMFITIPAVLNSMAGGRIVGIAFFLLVFFAALTSSVSLLETAVSTLQDEFHMERKKASLFMAGFMAVLGTLSALGFSVLSGVTPLGMDFLDFFDFLTNSVMMPLAALATCLLISRGRLLDRIAEEMHRSSAFRLEGMYRVMIRFICPILLAVILVTSILNVLGFLKL